MIIKLNIKLMLIRLLHKKYVISFDTRKSMKVDEFNDQDLNISSYRFDALSTKILILISLLMLNFTTKLILTQKNY